MRKVTVEQKYATLHVRNYNSVEELMQNVKPENIAEYVSDGNARFVGRDDLTTEGSAKKAFREEWADGMEYYREITQQLQSLELPEPVDVRRKPEWKDSGDDYDLDRARSGQDAWRGTRRRVTNQTMQVTVAINYGGNCNIRSKDMMWTTIAAIALTDRLETAGYQVRTVAAFRASSQTFNNHDGMVTFCLKDAGESVVASSMVNAISGWFFRTIVFGEMHNIEDQANSRVRPTLGHAVPIANQLPEHIDEQYKGGHFLIVPIVYSKDMAMPMMRLMIDKVNKLMTGDK